jgi:hypothetical protein
MPNGTLKLYNKLTNAVLVSLDIIGTFNIEENLNETPSNMKVKVITTDTYREEFQVNTIAYHEDTNSWWVIKSDESTYLHTGEYEHEIALVEYLEWYAYKHLTNCAFAPNTYTLEQMLERLFDIAKLDVEMVYPTFLSKDKIMPFLSFENFTVANAIKNVGRAINAIPKMTAGYPYALFTGSIGFSMSPPSTPTNGDYWYRIDTNQLYQRITGAWVLLDSTNGTTTPTIGGLPSLNFVNTTTQQLFISSSTWTPRLTFINRNGLDTAIVTTLNTQFPIAYEKNTNSSDQFTTRSISNVSNAKSSVLVIAPKEGGFKNTVPNSITFDDSNRDQARLFLPSKIDKIEYVKVLIPIVVADTQTESITYRGYYTNKQEFQTALENSGWFGPGNTYTNAQLAEAISNLPEPETFYKVLYNQEIDKTYEANTIAKSISLYYKKMNLLNKFEFDTASKVSGGSTIVDSDKKDRTIHWTPFTSEVIMPLSFRNGLTSDQDHNTRHYLVIDGTKKVYLGSDVHNITETSQTVVYNEDVLIQVAYYPIADIKVSIDNDNDAQDEKYFNQSGKVIDAVSVSKLITSHTNDSVEGTKIRNARYTSIASLLPVGQLVSDSGQLYVISQRSIDGQVKNGNEYYNVIYTLSRNRIARSENIVADSAVISYKTPDDNLVFRTQLYKDYLELSLVDDNKDTAPYLALSKALVFDDTLAGTNFDYTVLAKNDYGATPTVARYVQNPVVFDLHKAKLMKASWQDNNVLGFRLERVSQSVVSQTPILYTDNLGKATNFELLFVSEREIELAREDYNTPTEIDVLVPYADLTNVPSTFYSTDIFTDGRYSIRIQEPTYNKDPFEIPVFEYMLQVNDDYSSLGNVIVGNDLFSTFTGTLRYHYVINNTTRITAENANKLYTDSPPSSSTNRRVIFVRDSGTPHIIDLDLFSSYVNSTTNLRNSVDITNIGIYATDGTTVKFLFAINDYPTSGDDNDIRIFINNWKI